MSNTQNVGYKYWNTKACHKPSSVIFLKTSRTKGPVTRGNFRRNLQRNADDNKTLQVADRCQMFATLFATRNATNSLSPRLLETLQDFFL